MSRRQAPEISAGSMADIAFLLLVFFLVTSEMSKEEGILEVLPEYSTEQITEKVNDRNVIVISMNDDNKVLFEDRQGLAISEIPRYLKEQILNASNNPNMPENRPILLAEIEENIEKAKKKLENADPSKERMYARRLKRAELRLEAYKTFGNDFKVSKHIISITFKQGVEYRYQIALKDMINQTYKSLRNDLAKKKLKRGWDDLTLDEKEMLEMVYKKSVSENPILR